MTTHPRITLPSMEVAAGWLPVWCATGDDDVRPILHRTVCVEWFDGNGVRLVATDSHVLLSAWLGVTEDEPEPALDVEPDEVTVAADPDQRGKGLIKYAAACAKKDKDVDGTFHRTTLEVRSPAASRKTPALAEALQQLVLAVGYEGETVELTVVEAEYPSWRNLVAPETPAEATERIALSPHVLDVLAKTDREFSWTLHGELRGIQLRSVAGLPIRGVAMPIRVPMLEDEIGQAA